MDAISPPTSPIAHNNHSATTHHARPTSMIMSKHNRQSSRMADAASRSSDEDSGKTAVKVAVRVRPPLNPNDPGYDLIPQRFRESTCEVPTPTSLSVQSPQGRKLFVFDRVFDERTSQEGVWEYLSDSVASFVKGYNVSILAYGQSGAGKSYTMGTSGPDDQEDSEIRGIVPRAAKALFEKLGGTASRPSGLQTPKRYSTQGLPTLASMGKAATGAAKTWELKATYVEIYNEQLRDLLVSDAVSQQDRAPVAIREDTKGRIMLTGLTQVPINSPEDLLNALNFGSSIRQTDSTAINARSSRSHAVFSLNLVQRKSDASAPLTKAEKRMSVPVDAVGGAENVVTIDSKLHFVDLAGSERLKNTGATGERAKEGISINAGLASLGKVISQLSSRQGSGHISYRDSRLTRLLQDSLGGNAITFMVACVTPAVFHLSETLNTVHYAQRARAIQLRPEIQQSHEDSDKQAAIDRLRAEVTFLRDQIRHTENGGVREMEKHTRSDRFRGRETELQSQLMDMQENYNALSQRHAKLIAEISKARDDNSADTPLLNEAIGQNASERIKRSNSIAEAVESVVLEYEQTIQTLEGSLSKTRSSLSNTESSLLEKETRLAYMDTVQQQMQSRIQKYIDREQNNDSYTRDLETKMEGATSEEERKDTLIFELKKEITRARDSENNAEDYISTLEERLAEAEQDQEIMQREIDRLEHVVERQRSIGRLDNLLGELDGIRKGGPKTNGVGSHPSSPKQSTPKTNGHRFEDEDYDPFRPASESDSVYEDAEFEKVDRSEADSAPDIDGTIPAPKANAAAAQSASQNDFMAEKLENLTSEFFDLRSEHESVLTDYDNLQQKYRTALETLAKLEYDKEAPKSKHADAGEESEAFLTGAGMKQEERATGGQPSSSRSLLELSSQEPRSIGEEAETEHKRAAPERLGMVTEVTEHGDAAPAQSPTLTDHEDMLQEMETLKKLHAEKEVSVSELTKNYMSLAQRHETLLSQVSHLKQEVQRSQSNRPESPSFANSPTFSRASFRRKSDEMLSSGSDRASRSFVSLKTIGLNNFEDNAEVRQTFEQNLNTVMTELHLRSERVKALEAELGTVKKEMDTKQTLISGLTRERSSLKAAAASGVGVDFSVVGQMRDQLMESENQIRNLHEQHCSKEKEFQDEIDNLKATIAEHEKLAGNQLSTANEDKRISQTPGGFPETPMEQAPATEKTARQSFALAQHEDVARLHREVAAWETKHHEAMESMQSSQANLLNTISDLQESLRRAEQGVVRSPTIASVGDADDMEEERAMHKSVVNLLQKEVQEHKAVASESVATLEMLQKKYSDMQSKIDDDAHSRELSQRELGTHKELIANLENQLQVHKSAIAIHQESLESLQAAHTKEIDDLTADLEGLRQDHLEKHAAMQDMHEKTKTDLQNELQKSQNENTTILRNASTALGFQTDASKLHSQIKGLVEEGKELHGRHLKSTNELKAVQEELQTSMNKSVEMENQINELKMLSEERHLNLAKMTEKYNKSSRLVDELEEQLNSNFDSHKATNKRLSTFQSDAVQQRMELERELEETRLRNSQLEAQMANAKHQSITSDASIAFNRQSLSPEAAAIALARSASTTSNPARKSIGVTALPTPPPSIPLPPLPSSPTGGASLMGGFDALTPRATSPAPTTYSPPTSRHASHDVSGVAPSAQLVEEQEARIRTIEKHLFAEKQLTATLEEALVDLETSANRTKSEMDNWRKKCAGLEDELTGLRKERAGSRASLQAVEEEREMRVRAERARQALEQRMAELNATKKKKKSTLNCF